VVLSDSGKEFVAGHRLRQPQISILSVTAVARLFLGRTVLPEDPQPLATFFLRSSDIGLGTLTSRDSLHARQKAASRFIATPLKLTHARAYGPSGKQ